MTSSERRWSHWWGQVPPGWCRTARSRGLTLLARYQRLAAGTLSFFGIAALSERIMRAIELLGLAKLLTLYPTVDEAIKAASSM